MALSQAELAALYEEDEPKKTLSQEELAALFEEPEKPLEKESLISRGVKAVGGGIVDAYKGAGNAITQGLEDLSGLTASRLRSVTGQPATPEGEKQEKMAEGSYLSSVINAGEDALSFIPYLASLTSNPQLLEDITGIKGRELKPYESGYLAQALRERKKRIDPEREQARVEYGRGEGPDYVSAITSAAIPMPIGKSKTFSEGAGLLEKAGTRFIEGAKTGIAGSLMSSTGKDAEKIADDALVSAVFGGVLKSTAGGIGDAAGWVEDKTRPMWFRNALNKKGSSLEDQFGEGIVKDVRGIIAKLGDDDKAELQRAINEYKPPSGEAFSLDNAISQHIRKGIEEGKDPKVFGTALIRLQKELGETVSSKDFMETIKQANERKLTGVIDDLANSATPAKGSIEDKIAFLEDVRKTGSAKQLEEALNKTVKTESERSLIRKYLESNRAEVQQDLINKLKLVEKLAAKTGSLENRAVRLENEIGSDIDLNKLPEIPTGRQGIVNSLENRDLPPIESGRVELPPAETWERSQQMKKMLPYMNRVVDDTHQGDYSVYGRTLPKVTGQIDDVVQDPITKATNEDPFLNDYLSKRNLPLQPGIDKTRYQELDVKTDPFRGKHPNEIKAEILRERAAKQDKWALQAEREAAEAYSDIAKMDQRASAVKLDTLSDTSFNDLMKRPAIKQAYMKVVTGEKNRAGIDIGKNPESIKLNDLYKIKKELRDQLALNRGAPKGATAQDEANINGAIDSIDEYINRHSIDVYSSVKNYAKESLKIDQLKFMQKMKDVLRNPKDQETASAFMNLMNNESKALERGTGYGRHKTVEALMGTKSKLSRDVRSGIEGIKQSLLDREMAAKLGKGEAVMPALEGGIEGKAPNVLYRPVTIANDLISRLIKDKTPAYQQVAARIMTNQNEMLDTLKGSDKKMAIDFMNDVIKAVGYGTDTENM